MKLPELENAGVPDPGVNAALATTQAQQQLFKTLQEGFTAFGQEIVKSQAARASSKLMLRVNEIKLGLADKKQYTTQEVKDALGEAYEGLDPAVKSELVRGVHNPVTGQYEEFDRDDIPSFVVAGSIFDTQAKRAVADASKELSGRGWAADFQERALDEIAQQKASLAAEHLKEAHAYIRETTTEAAIDAAFAGNYSFARDTIRRMNDDADYKEKVFAHIDKIQETAPLFEALRKGDVGAMATHLGELSDPKKFTKLSPAERQTFSDRFKSEIAQFQKAVKTADEDRLKLAAELGWNGIFTKQRAGQLPTFADIPEPGSIPAESQKAMLAYVEKLAEGKPIKTDWPTYAGLLEVVKDKEKFAAVNLLAYRHLLADAQFTHLLEAQISAKGAAAGGNPDAYDQFQSTDEEVNTQLRSYGIDPSTKEMTGLAKVGYIKTMVQRELAAEQGAKGGKKLGLEERNAVISRVLAQEIDKKKGFFASTTVPAQKAGVPATIATTFQRAVTAIDPGAMADPERRVKTLERRYAEYRFYEPIIEVAWAAQAGANVMPDEAVKAWYHLYANWGRLEGQLRATGGWTDNEDLRKKRLTALAVQEIVATRAR